MNNATSTEKQFRGQVRLLTLLLWRVGKSTDVDACIKEAQSLAMIGEGDVPFIEKCVSAGERIESGSEPDLEITPELVKQLQACILKLNSADPA